MSTTKSPENQDTSLGRDLLHAARYYLGGRRGLLALAVVAIVAGFTLNWSWLVAAGIAPFLLGALPCVAMCALGLCAAKMGGKSCSTGAEPERAAEQAERPLKSLRNGIATTSTQQSQPMEERRNIDA